MNDILSRLPVASPATSDSTTGVLACCQML